jgi:hypothetical protein
MLPAVVVFHYQPSILASAFGAPVTMGASVRSYLASPSSALNLNARAPDEESEATVTMGSTGLKAPKIKNGYGRVARDGQSEDKAFKAGFIPARGVFGAPSGSIDGCRNPSLYPAGHQGPAVREAQGQRPAAVASGKLLACAADRQ